jgi:hypothetical protein
MFLPTETEYRPEPPKSCFWAASNILEQLSIETLTVDETETSDSLNNLKSISLRPHYLQRPIQRSAQFNRKLESLLAEKAGEQNIKFSS